MVPQPVVEASVETTTCLETRSKDTPARKKTEVRPRGEGLTAGWSYWDPERAVLPCPPQDSIAKPVLRRSHMKQSEWCCCGCHMPQEPLKYGRAATWRPSRFLHREKRSSILHGAKFALFPVDPKAQTS
ncbi:hypothetical protein PO909_005992 [Leuciscus waleckii]